MEFPSPAHRRDARHHQRAGADQYRSARLFAAGIRTAHHLSGGNRDGRFAQAQLHPFAVALRPVAGDGGIRRRHRHLLRPPASGGATSGAAIEPARRHRTGTRAHRHRHGRSADVRGGSCTRRAQTRWQRVHAHRSAHHTGLGAAPAVAHRARRGRDQHDRRQRTRNPHHARPGPPARTRFHLERRGARRGREQSQRGCRLHRTQWPAVSGARSGASAGYRRHRQHRAGSARRCADPRARCRTHRRGPRIARRRRHAERRGNRARHRGDACRRQQPRCGASCRATPQ